jgi:lipopolysaccharide assembly outer membrane protein LptD (OstA)
VRSHCAAIGHAVASSCLAAALVAVVVAIAFPLCSRAQTQEINETLHMSAPRAATWSDGPSNIIQLEGGATIELDQAKLTADGAVIWLTPQPKAVLAEQKVEIALIGNASLAQPTDNVTRTGDRLFVTTSVRGNIQLSADQRQVRNLSDSDVYKQAIVIRPMETTGPLPPGTTRPTTEDTDWLLQQPWMTPTSQPTTAPSTQPAPPTPTSFSADTIEGVKTPEGLVAFVLQGHVVLFQRRPNAEFLELQCERAVLFTPLRSLREMEPGQRISSAEEAVRSAYLEGDVRIDHVPGAGKKGGAEQRLTADRVYYDFTTDRAILTDAVVHTLDPKTAVPLIIRARTIRQLSEGEYTANKAVLTSSSFATPSYALGLGKVYVRQIDTGDPRLGTYTEFYGNDVTVNVYDHPFFYFPTAGGVISERGQVLRQLEVQGGTRFGTSLVTAYGLFEALGKIPPLNTDITFNVDYYGKRGPAGGLDGKYQGGTVSDTTKEPFAYSGDFSLFYVHDHGEDDLGRHRLLVEPPTENRGRIWMRHQQYLPDDWQVQLTLGYLSDPTFLEEWYPQDFFERGPETTSLYVKHQKDTEALTFLVDAQLNNFVTWSDYLQEQAEVERLPEIGYRRIGDSLADDSLTAFSNNVVSALQFRRSIFNLQELGFAPGQSVGLPSFGTTGEPGNVVYRGDFRQELDYPFSAGQFRVVPYVLGRYTVYSDSPDGGSKNRLLAGAGVRVTTAFWKVDDTVNSSLFDLHRLRHVIEPEVNLFTSASSVSRDHVFQYDEGVDEINDITGAQFALHQQWQTKRGGADRWRSVDFLDVNLEADLFTHKPKDPLIQPENFRGLFFESMPEASVPRNAINGDATWRVSDTTAVLGDFQYNLDQSNFATASIGIAVQRGDRLSYYLGQRYIEPLNSNIMTAALVYELTNKYTFGLRQSFDFGVQHSVSSSFALLRHFDRFYLAASIRFDEIGNTSGVMFNIIPEGLGKAASMGAAAIGNQMSTTGGAR